LNCYYIHIQPIPHIQPIAHIAQAHGASSFSSVSETEASVVKNIAAADTAFSRADLVTFFGSMIQLFTKSSYSQFIALNPLFPVLSSIEFTITAHSYHALSAICLAGY